MTSKREEIAKIIDEFVKWGEEQKLPYFDNKTQIQKFKREYTTDHIAGLVHKYCIPAYEQGLDTLKGYMNLELERLRMLGIVSGVDEATLKFRLSAEQEEHALNCIVKMIDVIAS